jgi:hypothetical protein
MASGSVAAWGRRQGISREAARKRVRSAGIPIDQNGAIDFELADRLWEQRERDSHARDQATPQVDQFVAIVRRRSAVLEDRLRSQDRPRIEICREYVLECFAAVFGDQAK